MTRITQQKQFWIRIVNNAIADGFTTCKIFILTVHKIMNDRKTCYRC